MHSVYLHIQDLVKECSVLESYKASFVVYRGQIIHNQNEFLGGLYFQVDTIGYSEECIPTGKPRYRSVIRMHGHSWAFVPRDRGFTVYFGLCWRCGGDLHTVWLCFSSWACTFLTWASKEQRVASGVSGLIAPVHFVHFSTHSPYISGN